MQRNATIDASKLVNRDGCIAALFGEESAPSVRTWDTWKKRRLIPFVKLGRLCFYDVAAVRDAIAKRLSVSAVGT